MNDITIVVEQPDWFGLVRQSLSDSKSKLTAKSYLAKVDDFWAWFVDNRDLYQTLAQAVDGYKTYCLEVLDNQPQTVNSKLSAIKTFFKVARRDNYVTEEIFDSIDQVENIKVKGRKRGNWFSVEQVRCVLNAPNDTPAGRRDRALLHILCCALRRSEVAGLTWGHLAQEDGQWVFRDIVGKGGRTRTVPLSGVIYQAIIDYRGHGPDDEYILCSVDRYGNYSPGISDQTVYDVFKRYLKECGIAKGSPHDMRRTMAKKLDQILGIDQVQLILGHSSVQTTERYVDKEMNVSGVSDALDGMLG